MKKAIVICGFPGVGMSAYSKQETNLKVLDLDSSDFAWIEGTDANTGTVEGTGIKEKNPNFPNNYIACIKRNLELVDVILVSTHREVVSALRKEEIEHYIIYPDMNLRGAVKCGSPKSFVEKKEDRWDDFYFHFFDDDINNSSSTPIMLAEGKYLSDVMPSLIIKQTINVYSQREFETMIGILTSNGYTCECALCKDPGLASTPRGKRSIYSITINTDHRHMISERELL